VIHLSLAHDFQDLLIFLRGVALLRGALGGGVRGRARDTPAVIIARLEADSVLFSFRPAHKSRRIDILKAALKNLIPEK